MITKIITDTLVVGAGLAGERVAIEVASRGFSVIILSLVPPRRSHSCAAAGGMQAALANCAMGFGDSPDIHFEDTVKGADWGCDQDVARLFVNLAPSAVRQLAYWGVPWNRVVAGKKRLPNGKEIEDLPEKEGLITARSFGGTAKWRTCYCSDGTGHSLVYTLNNEVVKLGVTVHDRMEAIALIYDGTNCYGVIARDLRNGELRAYLAGSTVIATGGYGRLYPISTNALINEGMGQSIALDTGIVPLANMEAVQFHPTALVPTYILITEACRGDGGYLLDKNQYRFMPDYEPAKKELASRDVVSRRMIQHIKKGSGVESSYGPHLWLDIRHLGREHIETKLRDVKEICMDFAGIDPVDYFIPVHPAQHYSMGGIRTNINGAAYELKGLFAAGEASCWDLHGFNRLGGNSLAETIVMGMVVGGKVADFIQATGVNIPSSLIDEVHRKQQERINNLLKGGKENVYEIRNKMQNILMEKVGIFRNGADLQAALEELQGLYERSQNLGLKSSGKGANPELALALRLRGMLRLAICITYGALKRTESRGAHYREDYLGRDDVNFLNRTLFRWKGEKDSLPEISYEPVRITELPPGERGYGERQFRSD